MILVDNKDVFCLFDFDRLRVILVGADQKILLNVFLEHFVYSWCHVQTAEKGDIALVLAEVDQGFQNLHFAAEVWFGQDTE